MLLKNRSSPLLLGGLLRKPPNRSLCKKSAKPSERRSSLSLYESRVNELVSGTVKKLGRDSVIVDLGNNAEGILTREHLIPREIFRIGDRLRAMLVEIRPDNRGPQLILSRTSLDDVDRAVQDQSARDL